MPTKHDDPGLSWARQILDAVQAQEKKGIEPDTEWTITEVLGQMQQEQPQEQPDTVKTTNCMHWALIVVFVCVLVFLASALVVWFVLME